MKIKESILEVLSLIGLFLLLVPIVIAYMGWLTVILIFILCCCNVLTWTYFAIAAGVWVLCVVAYFIINKILSEDKDND